MAFCSVSEIRGQMRGAPSLRPAGVELRLHARDAGLAWAACTAAQTLAVREPTLKSLVRRADLKLTAEQRGKIAKIQNDVRRKHLELMGKMQDEQAQMGEQYNSVQRDDAALSKSYRNMSELRHQMFDLSLSARKQNDAVPTRDQRDKVKHG